MSAKTERDKRLAAALRDNLRRRKGAQAPVPDEADRPDADHEPPSGAQAD